MPTSHTPPAASDTPRLHDTQAAFDSVAADYDGDRGNNALIQDMRTEMWRWLDATFAAGSRLLELGCGTGLDAVRMARLGHQVTASDWSAGMVERTRERARREQLDERVHTVHVGAHELWRVEGDGSFDGAYSNLGALNCVPDLAAVARECARLVRPGGALLFTVIGRLCPWEIAHYARRGKWARIKIRFSRNLVPVGMNARTVWTRYYGPREFYRPFRSHFSLAHFRGLCLFAPPPYLTQVRSGHPAGYARLWRLDRRAAGWPLPRPGGQRRRIKMRK